jgi:hypothetical protein
MGVVAVIVPKTAESDVLHAIRAVAAQHPGDDVLVVHSGRRTLTLDKSVRPSFDLRAKLAEFGEVRVTED